MKPGDSPTTEQLRDVLMQSVEVARAGQKEKPPIDPPARLKQVLTFKKFSERAMDQVREVVESDEEFRDRVVDASSEKDMGRVGWLWLTRPDGWQQESAELTAEAQRKSEAAADAQKTQELEQRLQRAEAAQKKADNQRDKASRERDEARIQAAQARTEVRRAEEEAQRLVAELDQARAALDAAESNSARAQRKQNRTDEKLRSAVAQVDRLKKQLRDSREQHGEEVSSLKARLAVAEDEVAMARAVGFELPPEVEPKPATPLLTKRTPVPMPGGLLNDTPEAAEFLLRQVPEVVVLVDGYNVTFKNWEKLPLQEQRHRFLQKMEELSARYTGAEFVVVFDGTETDYDYISTTARSLGVTVRFSQPGVTADDYIINQCDSHPLSRQLVVVSEDGEVRERARDRGANLVHPRKLLEIMGLEVEYPDSWTGFGDR
ncbi:NYN domain-containing protein [Candidatus Poriferisocius sp.]|uniref:NYN domain-containing protein n=1 Tax=Candidatus Poriferisocius sp. TaxID=3101276 RepID=UPI003B014304